MSRVIWHTKTKHPRCYDEVWHQTPKIYQNILSVLYLWWLNLREMSWARRIHQEIAHMLILMRRGSINSQQIRESLFFFFHFMIKNGIQTASYDIWSKSSLSTRTWEYRIVTFFFIYTHLIFREWFMFFYQCLPFGLHPSFEIMDQIRISKKRNKN